MLRFVSTLFSCFSRRKTEVGPDDDEVTFSGNQNVSTGNLHCDTPVPVPVVRQISQEIDIPPARQRNEFWWTDNPPNQASIVLEVAKMADEARKNRSRRQDTVVATVPVSRFDTVSIKSNETCGSFVSNTAGDGCNCLSEKAKRHKIGVVVPCSDSPVPRVFAFVDDEMQNQHIMEKAQSIAVDAKPWKAFIYFNIATKKVELDIEGCANV